MKLFGVVLLAGYFLARKNEKSDYGRNGSLELIRDWAIYVACAGLTFFGGLILRESPSEYNFLALLLVAALPVIVFRGRTISMLAGTGTAFCVLRLMANFGKAATVLLLAEAAVLMVAFLYRGAQRRMMRLHLPVFTEKRTERLILLFAITVFLTVIYEKVIHFAF